MAKPSTIKYIDLCCGLGGFRVALDSLSSEEQRLECVLSADIKQDALDTYNLNFGEDVQPTDIYDLDPEAVPSFDLLCAGFPCQPFSSAGQKKGFADKRGGMIFKIVDLCKHHRPDYVLLENVYNLMTLESGKCIQRIRELFVSLGYHVAYKKLNSRDFGCPQSRERVYIVCTRNADVDLEAVKPTEPVCLGDVIDESDLQSDIDPVFGQALAKLHREEPLFGKKIGDKRGGQNNIHSWDIGHNGPVSLRERELMEAIMRERRKKHWAAKKGIVWMDGMPLTKDEVATFFDDPSLAAMLDNLTVKNYLRLEKPKDLVDGRRQYKEDAEVGYNICKGKLSFPISKILDPAGVAPTLTATDSHKLAVVVGDGVVRRLTSDEMRQICGFPDGFTVPDHANYADLFGNMATPPVIRAVAELMLA
jgi:DNA (cytosine-5)-methyltransferase 1